MNTYGSSRKSADLERLENRKPLFFVFEHDHWWAKVWSYTMHVLLIYTAFNIPLNVAFEQNGVLMVTLDKIIDYCFYIDLIMNFITGYENDDKNSEFRLKNIAIRSVKSWFLIDLMACLPFDLVFEIVFSQENEVTSSQTSQEAAKLLRLAKLPRLYRLIRIVRLLRLLKMGSSLKKMFDVLKVN